MNFYKAEWGCFACFSGKAWYNFGERVGRMLGSGIKTVRSGRDARMMTFEYAGVTCWRGAKRRRGGGRSEAL